MKKLVSILVFVLLCGVASASAVGVETISMPASVPITCDESYDGEQMLDNPNSVGVTVTENSISFNTPAKDNHSHYQGFLVRNSHSVNSVIAVYKSSFIGFVRAVDKYIYFLRHIII